MICFNPLDKFYKSNIGAIPNNTKTIFRVKGNFGSVTLLVKKDEQIEDNRFEMVKIDDYFECEISLPIGLYFYCFLVDNCKFIGLNQDYLGEITLNPTRFQLTVYDSECKVPKWLYGGVIYQIFPDRFNCGNKDKQISPDKILHDKWDEMPVFKPNQLGKIVNNDFFGGDIKGVIAKIDYLCQLGVTAIYLNPIFKAFSNHRYDTGDYMQIDELLGNEKDFKELICVANEKGIKIILDGVFNHTGDDSLYFNKYGKYNSLGAYQSKQSRYYDWFKFTDFPDKYNSWWGITVLPETNEENQDFIDFITGDEGVIAHYTKLGIGGWRLDVVDELPDEFVEKIRNSLKKYNNDGILIGEVWEDASNKISYGKRRKYFQGKELDSVMNYPLKDAILQFVKYGDCKKLFYVIKEQIDHYPKDVLNNLMNILSTHDTYRLLNAIDNADLSNLSKEQLSKITFSGERLIELKNKLKIATLLQFTLCGVPSIYYGDEVGMQGYSDPLNRATFPWGKEDKEILSWYKFLGQVRSDYSAFKDGEYNQLYCADGAFVFTRSDEFSQLLIGVNVGKIPITLEFNDALYDLISKTKHVKSITLETDSCCVLIKNT